MTKSSPAEIVQSLVTSGPARRSALFRHLRKHHRRLSKAFDQLKPDWTLAAAKLGSSGLFGANGKPISPNALRQMWARVAADVQKERAESSALTPAKPKVPGPVATLQPKSSPVTPASPYVPNHRPYSHPDDGKLPAPAKPPAAPAGRSTITPPEPPDLSQMSDHAREQYAKLDVLFAETDRKRFGRFR